MIDLAQGIDVQKYKQVFDKLHNGFDGGAFRTEEEQNEFDRILKENSELLMYGANYYYGNDSYGRRVEVGIRKDGVQFCRSYGYNGYGMGWSKWREVKNPAKIIGLYSYYSLMEWGFNNLTGFRLDKGIRLPKAK